MRRRAFAIEHLVRDAGRGVALRQPAWATGGDEDRARGFDMERIVIVALLTLVVFLVWERFHYRRRISELYDTVIKLTRGLDQRFELRSHPVLRRYYVIDAIIDDIEDKLDLLSRGPANTGFDD